MCLEALYSALVVASMAKKLDLCRQGFNIRSKHYKCAFLLLFRHLPGKLSPEPLEENQNVLLPRRSGSLNLKINNSWRK